MQGINPVGRSSWRLIVPVIVAGLLLSRDASKICAGAPPSGKEGPPARAQLRPVDAPLDEPKGAHLTLVSQGVPRATIVVMKEAIAAPAEPEAANLSSVVPLATKIAGAARELQTYLQKMSGGKLPIVGDDQSPQGTLILVGRSALTRPLDARIPAGLTPQRNEEGFLLLAK